MRTLRLSATALTILGGFATAAFFPLLPGALRLGLMRLWCRAMLASLGVRLQTEGQLDPRPALLVANHVSWLDILAICALRPALFVCKSDIADWPGFGWLLERVGTIFMRRGSAHSAARSAAAATRCLRSGVSVAVFPEGTSSNGEQVLPFSAALFQAAVDSGCPVQPLALSYSSQAAVYAYSIGLGESMLAVAEAHNLRVTLSALPVLEAACRRDAALRAHELIAQRVRAGTFPAASGHALEDPAEGRLVAADAGHPGLG